MIIIVSGMSLSFYHSRPALFDLHFRSSQKSVSANDRRSVNNNRIEDKLYSCQSNLGGTHEAEWVCHSKYQLIIIKKLISYS